MQGATVVLELKVHQAPVAPLSCCLWKKQDDKITDCQSMLIIFFIHVDVLEVVEHADEHMSACDGLEPLWMESYSMPRDSP